MQRSQGCWCGYAYHSLTFLLFTATLLPSQVAYSDWPRCVTPNPCQLVALGCVWHWRPRPTESSRGFVALYVFLSGSLIQSIMSRVSDEDRTRWTCSFGGNWQGVEVCVEHRLLQVNNVLIRCRTIHQGLIAYTGHNVISICASQLLTVSCFSVVISSTAISSTHWLSVVMSLALQTQQMFLQWRWPTFQDDI